MKLKYGCNPHQGAARAEPLESGAPLPVECLNGNPSLINLLDALNGWQLVRELRAALDLPAASSFKHVSPAGAAVAVPLEPELQAAYEVRSDDLTPAATAYARARGADPKSCFGDWVALSDPVDGATARFLAGVISDGIVAPAFEPDALEVLCKKKGGSFVVLRADPAFEPPAIERRELFGVRLEQERNARTIGPDDLADVVCGELTEDARRDLLIGLITLKYTQSNSMGYALGGQMIGVGAGQQSRVDCTKLAGAKADVWHLMRHPAVQGLRFKRGVRRQERINWRVRFIEGDWTELERKAFEAVLEEPLRPLAEDERRAWLGQLGGVSLVSDAFIPFRDNIDHAARHGVRFVAHPGGSARDAEVAEACREHGMTLVQTGIRLFHH